MVEDETDAAVPGYSLQVTSTSDVTLEDTANASDVITVTNTYSENVGSLKITKNVTVNGSAVTTGNATPADGTYTFTIKQNGTAISGGKVGSASLTNGQVNIEISNGQSKTVEVTDLAPGKYTIHEETPTNRTSLVGNNDVSVTVEAGKTGNSVASTGIGTFKNNINTGSITVKKVKAGSAVGKTEFQVALQEVVSGTAVGKYYKQNGEATDVIENAYVTVTADATEGEKPGAICR